MKKRFWRRREKRCCRVEFRDGRATEHLCGIRKVEHEGVFITVRTKREILHCHQAEVRLVHVYEEN